MRPLSQAECPIRLTMRKRRQGPLKKEREGEGDRGIKVVCNTEKGEDDENVEKRTDSKEREG